MGLTCLREFRHRVPMGSRVNGITSLRFILRLATVIVACISVSTCRVAEAAGGCGFPALFGFGTSLSDTGNGVLLSPIFRAGVQSPYGETYFGRPEGRFCDGRLVVDFLAQSVGLPFLKPYFAYKTAGTDFSQGINYAVAGATVLRPGYLVGNGDVTFVSLKSLNVQIGWHLAIQQAAQSPELAASSYPGVTLPSPNAISDALYYFEFGGNDYGSYFTSKYTLRPGQRGMNIDNSYVLSNVVPVVVQGLVSAVETLYANSARNFIIFGILPEGCASLFLKLLNGTKDAFGCLSALNEVDSLHNQQISAAAEGLRNKYPDINVMIADDYSFYVKVVENPSQYGFSETINACCGAGPNVNVSYQFSFSKICRSPNYVCPKPSSYLMWDGIHPTDNANRYIVNAIISGQYLTPSNGLACASSV